MKKEEMYVVAIGTSAGGLEALFTFFQHVPTHLNVAYIVVRHLKRNHNSIQSTLLKPYTNLKIKNIEGGETIQKGYIYTMPENTKLTIEEGVLHLHKRPETEIINTAIDDFFISLAHDAKEKAIGIILTGTGNDGTRGAYAIEELGGIVMVQEPTQAQFDGMPKSVIYFDHPDYILRIEEMGNYIQAHIQNPKKARLLIEKEKQNG